MPALLSTKCREMARKILLLSCAFVDRGFAVAFAELSQGSGRYRSRFCIKVCVRAPPWLRYKDLDPLNYQRTVLRAEANTVTQCHPDLRLPPLVSNVVEIALGIW